MLSSPGRGAAKALEKRGEDSGVAVSLSQLELCQKGWIGEVGVLKRRNLLERGARKQKRLRRGITKIGIPRRGSDDVE